MNRGVHHRERARLNESDLSAHGCDDQHALIGRQHFNASLGTLIEITAPSDPKRPFSTI